MRLPHNRIDENGVASSKPVLSEVEGPQALGMLENAILLLNTYKTNVAITIVALLDCFTALAMIMGKELL
jgi:hypothetical protein